MSQYNDVIVYVVINFVQILFHIRAKTLMVYPCSKFHCDTCRSTPKHVKKAQSDLV